MRVEVLRVLDARQRIVEFSCEWGVANGRWMGANTLGVGRFDVEIEIPDEITEWAAAPAPGPSLSNAAETADVVITCEIEKVGDGDDPVVEARLGADILLIEVPHRRSELAANQQITFRTPEIQLFPYSL